MQTIMTRVVTPPPPDPVSQWPHRLPGTFIIPQQHWINVARFEKWTKAGREDGCRLQTLSTCRNLNKEQIYEIHVRLVGGFDCQKTASVLSEQPPFKNGKQFKRWIERHTILNNILLAKWIHEKAAMPPDNRPANFVMILVVQMLGKHIRQLGHIFSGIRSVKVWGIKYGTVQSKSIGETVRKRRATKY